jgi:DNA-binding transcriptional MerR regulator
VSDDDAKHDALRSGELARLAGVSTDTLRHYERKGVLSRPQRTPNGYRCYPPAALARVQLVRRALAVGFTLEELAAILRAREHGRAPCREVRELAARKLAQIELRLAELIALREELRATLHDWDTRLAHVAAGERAGLLEALATQNGPRRAAGKRLFTTRSKRKEKKDAK